jgi:hypothetical protein
VQPGRLPSLRFSAPTASPRSQQQHDGRVCLARPLAPSGFLDLSAPSSAVSLPALFHAGSAHGVVPFRALLLPCSRTPSPAPFPSCRWTHLSEPNPPRAIGCRSSFSRAGPVTALEPPKRPSSRGPSSHRSDLPIRRPTTPRPATEAACPKRGSLGFSRHTEAPRVSAERRSGPPGASPISGVCSTRESATRPPAV